MTGVDLSMYGIGEDVHRIKIVEVGLQKIAQWNLYCGGRSQLSFVRRSHQQNPLLVVISMFSHGQALRDGVQSLAHSMSAKTRLAKGQTCEENLCQGHGKALALAAKSGIALEPVERLLAGPASTCVAVPFVIPTSDKM